MDLNINPSIEDRYKSTSQKARLLTERWTHESVACPACGGALNKYPNNRPVADFACKSCSEDFELKATAGRIGRSIPDGAYFTMIERLSAKDNPNLFLLEYDSENWLVRNLLVIPKYFFSASIIQKRIPLASTARRAGWIGCNILIGDIPQAGRIPLVVDRNVMPFGGVTAAWKKTRFLKETSSDGSKTWLLKTMSCIDEMGKRQFELKEIYRFEPRLQEIFPGNQHIREKLRQQLQVLRDSGYLKFLGDGRYELSGKTKLPPIVLVG